MLATGRTHRPNCLVEWPARELHDGFFSQTVGMRSLLIVAIAVAVLAGCGSPNSSSATSAPDSTEAGSSPKSTSIPNLRLQEVDASFDSPIAGASIPGSDSFLIAERAGRVIAVNIDESGEISSSEPILDIADQVGSTEAERGLLGIAVRPDGSELFVSYTSVQDGSSQLDSYKLSGTQLDGMQVVPKSKKNVLSVAQPFGNHNGGHIAFGPDGFLYLSLGDGGSSGDPEGNAQNRSVLLGKILRLDPDAPQAVAAGNPFIDSVGAQPQIWLTGVRNPWRFSFDSATGDLWIGDVGESQTEEINFLAASEGGGRGANLGWDIFEGTAEFSDSNPADGESSAGPFTQPILSYSHDEGCSVTGGVVYRGKKIPDLQGAYLYADFCNPALQSMRLETDQVITEQSLGVELQSTVSFFEDSSGEVYVIGLDDGVFRLLGQE